MLTMAQQQASCTDLECSLKDRLQQEGMSDLWPLGMHAYLAYGASPDFIVDLDDVFPEIGFECREDAKAMLVRHTSAGKDYTSCLRKGIDGTRVNEVITLTVQAFKKLCMIAKTDSSMRVLECYMMMEAVHAAKQIEISTAAQATAVKLQAQLDLAQAKTYSEVPKPEWVYICKEAAELAGDAHKIGRTIDLRKRESALNCGSAQGAKMLYERATHNSKAVEDLIKAVMKQYHISSAGGTEHYRCNVEHSTTVIDIACIVVDTIASCYEAMPRAEMCKLVASRILDACANEWQPVADKKARKQNQPKVKIPIAKPMALTSPVYQPAAAVSTPKLSPGEEADVIETTAVSYVMQALNALGVLDKIVLLPDGRHFMFKQGLWEQVSDMEVLNTLRASINEEARVGMDAAQFDYVKSWDGEERVVKMINSNIIDHKFVSKLDKPIEGCLPFKNKMYNAMADELRDVTPRDMVTITTGYNIIPKGDIPLSAFEKMDRFYAQVIPQPDERNIFQKVIGNAMFGIGDDKNSLSLSREPGASALTNLSSWYKVIAAAFGRFRRTKNRGVAVDLEDESWTFSTLTCWPGEARQWVELELCDSLTCDFDSLVTDPNCVSAHVHILADAYRRYLAEGVNVF
jgi:hypothetical protein